MGSTYRCYQKRLFVQIKAHLREFAKVPTVLQSAVIIIYQFLDTAISEEVMAVNHSIVAVAEDSAWNPSGRSVIFVERPAFNHNDAEKDTRLDK